MSSFRALNSSVSPLVIRIHPFYDFLCSFCQQHAIETIDADPGGVSRVVAALKTFRALSKFTDATLQAVTINALLLGFIKSNSGLNAVGESFTAEDLKGFFGERDAFWDMKSHGYVRPAGGFFLWLDVSKHGGSEIATKRLWAEAGVRVVPGRYLAREQADGSNPGADFIRVAMVQDKAATAEALHRIVATLV